MSCFQLGNWPSISREARVTGPALKTAWLRESAISTCSVPSWATIRASSRSAFAGTFASMSSAIGCSSSECLTLSR